MESRVQMGPGTSGGRLNPPPPGSAGCGPTSSSESLDSGWLEAPLRKGSMGCPILAMREMRLALVASGFWGRTKVSVKDQV